MNLHDIQVPEGARPYGYRGDDQYYLDLDEHLRRYLDGEVERITGMTMWYGTRTLDPPRRIEGQFIDTNRWEFIVPGDATIDRLEITATDLRPEEGTLTVGDVGDEPTFHPFAG